MPAEILDLMNKQDNLRNKNIAQPDMLRLNNNITKADRDILLRHWTVTTFHNTEVIDAIKNCNNIMTL